MEKALRILSIVADVLTILSLLWAIFWSLYLRKKNLVALKVNVFIVSLFRIAFICIIGAIFFKIWEILYVFSLVIFNGSSPSDKYYWDDENALLYILAYLTSTLLTLIPLWLIISIIWTSSFEYIIDFFNVLVPKKIRIIKKNLNKLKIIEAKYGKNGVDVDVTDKLNKMVINNTLSVVACNELAGDPIKDVVKELKIKYSLNDYEIKEVVVEENQSITLSIRD